MYESISPLKVSSIQPRKTNKKVFDNIVGRLSNVDKDTTFKELTDINKYIEKNKSKLSKEDYNTMKDFYKSSKGIWKDLDNERKVKEELNKVARLATKKDDYRRRQVTKIEQMEQDILKAKDRVKARQKWERAKERAIEQIWEEYGLDAEAAYEKYLSFI